MIATFFEPTDRAPGPLNSSWASDAGLEVRGYRANLAQVLCHLVAKAREEGNFVNRCLRHSNQTSGEPGGVLSDHLRACPCDAFSQKPLDAEALVPPPGPGTQDPSRRT